MPIPEIREGGQQLDRDQVIDWLRYDFKDDRDAKPLQLLADLTTGAYDPERHDLYPEGYERISDWFRADAVAALGESMPVVVLAREERMRRLHEVARTILEPSHPALRYLKLGAGAIEAA